MCFLERRKRLNRSAFLERDEQSLPLTGNKSERLSNRISFIPITRRLTHLTTSDCRISSKSNDGPYDKLQRSEKNLMMSFRRRGKETVVFHCAAIAVSNRHKQGREWTYPCWSNCSPVSHRDNHIPPIDPTTPHSSASALLPWSKPISSRRTSALRRCTMRSTILRHHNIIVSLRSRKDTRGRTDQDPVSVLLEDLPQSP